MSEKFPTSVDSGQSYVLSSNKVANLFERALKKFGGEPVDLSYDFCGMAGSVVRRFESNLIGKLRKDLFFPETNQTDRCSYNRRGFAEGSASYLGDITISHPDLVNDPYPERLKLITPKEVTQTPRSRYSLFAKSLKNAASFRHYQAFVRELLTHYYLHEAQEHMLGGDRHTPRLVFSSQPGDVIMQSVDGQNLYRTFLRVLEGDIVAQEIIDLMISITEAVAFIHDQGMIHGDLKLSNIVVSDDKSKAKIIDFGTAFSSDNLWFDHDNTFRGTPAYTLPPDLEAAKPPDKLRDIRSLGLVFASGIITRFQEQITDCIIGKPRRIQDYQRLVNTDLQEFIDYKPVLKTLENTAQALKKLVKRMVAFKKPEQGLTAADVLEELHSL